MVPVGPHLIHPIAIVFNHVARGAECCRIGRTKEQCVLPPSDPCGSGQVEDQTAGSSLD
jgi:hypothetical protein